MTAWNSALGKRRRRAGDVVALPVAAVTEDEPGNPSWV